MTHKDYLTQISSSAEIVQYLRTETKMTLKQIGELIGKKESFISLVGNNKRNFTVVDLVKLEKAMGHPLPLLILESARESVPAELKDEYEQLRTILQLSSEERTQLFEQINLNKNTQAEAG